MMDLSPPPINNILCLLFIIVLVYNLLIIVLIYKNDDGIYADIIISKSGIHTINTNDWNPIIHFSSAIQMSLIEVCTCCIHDCHQVSQHISDHNLSDKSSVVFSRPVHYCFEKTPRSG